MPSGLSVIAQVGPQATKLQTGTNANLRQGNQTDLMVSELHGKYYEQVYQGNMYFGANSAAQATTVALATTYTGLVLSNPLASGKNLVLINASFALSVAPAAIAPIMLFVGFSATTNVTHTTPVVPQGNLVGTVAGVGKLDSSATLTGTPVWALPLYGGFTAAALPNPSTAPFDVAGLLVIPPGGYVGIGSLTAVTGFGSLHWEEVPV
jgi:hypothetical protein